LSPIEPSLELSDVRPGWVDLPPNRLLTRIPEVIQDKLLTDLILEYHDIPKDEVPRLPDRCIALDRISQHIESAISAGSSSKTLSNLRTTALKKRGYLERLSRLYKNEVLLPGAEIYDTHKIKSYFEDIRPLREKQQVLNNKVHYDSKSARFWGEYWLEVTDPCHRPLEHYKEQWLQDGALKPFFMWLETHEVSPYHARMDYLRPAERMLNKLTVADGLVHKGHQVFTTAYNSEHLLVINQDLEIISHPSSEFVRHISLTAGKPVLAAGSIKTLEGIPTEIHSDSGHYLPDEAVGRQMLELLKSKGFQIDDSIPFFYFRNFGEVKTTVGEFLHENKSYGEIAPRPIKPAFNKPNNP
jgi:hypothetical protein